MQKTLFMVLISFYGLLCLPAGADVRLPAQFGDHMVLQRNVPLPIWGWAAPGEQVTVRLARQSQQAITDATGVWRVSLPKMRAGGPYTLTVNGRTAVTCADVLIGEVWLCSGQSNMAIPLSYAANADQAIRAAYCPSLRLFSSWYASRQTPQVACGGAWRVSTPESAQGFSAVAYFFGRKLQHELGVPVGVVQAAVGATAIESWINRTGIAGDPELNALGESADAETAKYPADVDDTGWEAPGLADADWREMTQPQGWDAAKAGMISLDGVVWLRRAVAIPAEWASKSLTLRFGPIDDGDSTYFNGLPVGAMDLNMPDVWKTPRAYTVPAGLVQAGAAEIAVRISNQFGGGGILGTPEQMTLAPTEAPGAAISLAGPWRYRIAASWPENACPTGLYNGMIAPWTHCAIAGMVWYQGESNAGAAGRYRHLLPAMIAGWRSAWRRGDLPFLIVQLPNYLAAQPEPGESSWAELRDVQAFAATALPNVGLAVTIDIGDPQNIHPTRKLEVGDRLVLQALGIAYHRTSAYAGPTFAGMTREGDTALRVTFTHTDGGLRTVDGGPVRGFAIAGANNKFVWAKAIIEGDTIIVSNPFVTNPTAIRYAWADNPAVNLTNGAGLPAGPFRTK